jgi:hypothetical protein
MLFCDTTLLLPPVFLFYIRNTLCFALGFSQFHLSYFLLSIHTLYIVNIIVYVNGIVAHSDKTKPGGVVYLGYVMICIPHTDCLCCEPRSLSLILLVSLLGSARLKCCFIFE